MFSCACQAIHGHQFFLLHKFPKFRLRSNTHDSFFKLSQTHGWPRQHLSPRVQSLFHIYLSVVCWLWCWDTLLCLFIIVFPKEKEVSSSSTSGLRSLFVSDPIFPFSYFNCQFQSVGFTFPRTRAPHHIIRSPIFSTSLSLLLGTPQS